jgi:hypothetical protein
MARRSGQPTKVPSKLPQSARRSAPLPARHSVPQRVPPERERRWGLERGCWQARP